jgi:hypothetical protein
MDFFDFQKLILQLSTLSQEPAPCYSIIQDMFDVIDKKKDAKLD